jgi:glutathionylspermidine amidase/synthetase
MKRVDVYKRPEGRKTPDEPVVWNGIYTGIKYQCVELARRYYLVKYNRLFEPVSTAKDLVNLTRIQDLGTGDYLAWPTHPNRAESPRPVIGSLLLWDNEGAYAPNGHVSVVLYVGRTFVDIVEQNYGRGHRRLPIRDGIIASRGLLGWKQPEEK